MRGGGWNKLPRKLLVIRPSANVLTHYLDLGLPSIFCCVAAFFMLCCASDDIPISIA